MKILFLSTSFPRFKDDWVLPSLDVEARELSRCKNNEVIVISSSGTDTKDFELREKVKIYRFNYFIKKYQTLTYTGGLSTSFKEDRILSKIKSLFFVLFFTLNTIKYGRKCDVIHAHWTPSAFAAIPLKIFYKKPIAVSLLGADVRLLPKWINKFILRCCDAIISPVPIFNEYLKEIGITKNIYDIKHCYNYDKFDKKDDTSNFKKEFNLKDEKIITFIGRMDKFKDPISFIKSIPYVLKKTKNIKFFVVGYGFLLDDIKKLVKKLRLEKHVIITGPRKDINIILEASDIFVNLSPDENYFSVAIQESMAKKTPCLLTNAGQTEKTFTHKENVYLVNPKSPEETADAIIKLLTNKKLCKKLGENGIKLLKKHRYTKDDIINELNSLYKKLVN